MLKKKALPLVLSVVADIAKRLSIANPNSENPLKEEAVILINEQIEYFSNAIDTEDYEKAKKLYKELLSMLHPESQERKILDLDMEMIEANDKT